MPELPQKLAARIPLALRVLFHQFLLRVIDLEALSLEADVTRFLGQFAGVLLMFSFIHTLIAWIYMAPMQPAARFGYACHFEQYQIATMLLVVGLYAVISWDGAFPDRRDILVLSPLPVRPRTLMIARLAANFALVPTAVVCLNALSGIVWPFALGIPGGWINGFARTCAAWWLTMTAASVFLYASLLAIQGLGTLLLSRKAFLRFSAFMQLAAFGTFLCVYFLEGVIDTPHGFADPANHGLLASSPVFWFFALFNQVRGALPPELDWLAWRAWIGLGIACSCAIASLLLSYRYALRRMAETPDLIPARNRRQSALHTRGGLQLAILQFSLRTLARSRHHRVILAFYLSIVLALTLTEVRRIRAGGGSAAFSSHFALVSTLMMAASILGFRKVFSIPVSWTANWMLRTSQVSVSARYIAASRRVLLLLSVLPAWLLAAVVGMHLRPLEPVVAHLVLLALFGILLTEVTLIGFHKVPFTCSLLPGNSDFQFFFWSAAGGVLLLTIGINWGEIPALRNPVHVAMLAGVIAVPSVLVWAFNRLQSKTAQLYFEELPDPVLVTLNLTIAPRAQDDPVQP